MVFKGVFYKILPYQIVEVKKFKIEIVKVDY